MHGVFATDERYFLISSKRRKKTNNGISNVIAFLHNPADYAKHVATTDGRPQFSCFLRKHPNAVFITGGPTFRTSFLPALIMSPMNPEKGSFTTSFHVAIKVELISAKIS
jgi:hypothetical protein